jgi:hypothetical protein
MIENDRDGRESQKTKQIAKQRAMAAGDKRSQQMLLRKKNAKNFLTSPPSMKASQLTKRNNHAMK